MINFTPEPPPTELSAENIGEWVYRQFLLIATFDNQHFQTLYTAPTKPRDGDVVLADGTSWNPGSGQGFYGFYAAAWHKLG